MTYTPTTWVDNTTVANAASMNNIDGGITDALAAAVAVGDVQFTVGGSTAGGTVANGGFSTYPLATTATLNTGGGSWSSSTFIYTVPKDGLYLCLGGIRMTDNTSTAFNVATGIGTSNADTPVVLWADMGNMARSARQYVCLSRFSTSDQVRLYIYGTNDFVTHSSGAGQFLSLIRVAD